MPATVKMLVHVLMVVFLPFKHWEFSLMVCKLCHGEGMLDIDANEADLCV